MIETPCIFTVCMHSLVSRVPKIYLLLLEGRLIVQKCIISHVFFFSKCVCLVDNHRVVTFKRKGFHTNLSRRSFLNPKGHFSRINFYSRELKSAQKGLLAKVKLATFVCCFSSHGTSCMKKLGLVKKVLFQFEFVAFQGVKKARFGSPRRN